jgi:hypothetical protein
MGVTSQNENSFFLQEKAVEATKQKRRKEDTKRVEYKLAYKKNQMSTDRESGRGNKRGRVIFYLTIQIQVPVLK